MSEHGSNLEVELEEIRVAIKTYIHQNGECLANVLRVKTLGESAVDLDFSIRNGGVYLHPDMDVLKTMHEFVGMYTFCRNQFYHPDGWMSITLGYKSTDARDSFKMIACVYETPPQSA